MSKSNIQKDHQQFDKTEWKESPYLIIKGFLMGSADIVPGVSGGTLALITGIYNRLINAIKSLDVKAIKGLFTLQVKAFFEHVHWKFLLLVITGAILAVLFFTRVVPLQVYMFTHPEIVYGLFFGLIVGSVFLLVAEIKHEKKGWLMLLPLLAGTLFGYWIVTLVPADTPETFLFVFLSGSVAICAMILPGISGSYILLILRKYDYILSQLGNIGSAETTTALLNLFPFVLGAIIGLAVFARILAWLLRHFHATTLLVLIGFLIGSLYVIWPYQEREFAETVRETREVETSSELVRELFERDGIPKTPYYQRIQRVEEMHGLDADFVIVETVSRRMISSEPYLPRASEGSEEDKEAFWDGLKGMSIGFLMIVGIAYLRRRTS